MLHEKVFNNRQTLLSLLLVVMLLACAVFSAAATAAKASPACTHFHQPGYYHAVCKMKHPKSFHITGVANRPYSFRWELTCYDNLSTNETIGKGVSYPHTGIVAGRFDFTVMRDHFAAQYRKMLRSKKCTIEVAFNLYRPAARHRLDGSISFNGIPRQLIYDRTKG